MQRAERRGDREGALADLVDGMTSRAIEANKPEPRRSEGDSGTLGSLAAGGRQRRLGRDRHDDAQAAAER